MRRSVGILILCGLAFGLLGLAAAASEAAGEGGRELVSVQVRDADIQDVVQQAIAPTGCEVVIDGDVQGRITLDLRDVPVARVLDRICLAKGYHWWQDEDGTYFVGSSPQPVRAPTATPLTASPPAPGKTHRLHALRFTSSQFLSYLFGSSDDPGPMPTAAGFPPVGDAGRVAAPGITPMAPGQLGGGLGGGGGGGGGGGLGGGGLGGGGGAGVVNVMQGALIDLLPAGVDSIIAYPVLNSLILTGTEEGVNELIDIIKQLDRKPQQVIIDITTISVVRGAAKDFGIEWDYTAGGAAISTIGFSAAGSISLSYLAPDNFNAVLNWLITSNKGRVVDSLRVHTMNLIPATNQVVTTYPWVQIGAVGGAGLQGQVATTVNVTNIALPTTIDVTPMIHPDNTITLSIPIRRTTVPSFQEVSIEGVGTFRFPVTVTTFLVSTANVRDGGTIVLGGSVQADNRESVTEVPLLADLPLIGQFFKRRTINQTETETLTFFTPRIVREEPGPATLGPI